MLFVAQVFLNLCSQPHQNPGHVAVKIVQMPCLLQLRTLSLFT